MSEIPAPPPMEEAEPWKTFEMSAGSGTQIEFTPRSMKPDGDYGMNMETTPLVASMDVAGQRYDIFAIQHDGSEADFFVSPTVVKEYPDGQKSLAPKVGHVTVSKGESLTFGRSLLEQQGVIGDFDALSREQVKIEPTEDGGMRITQLGGTNPTKLSVAPESEPRERLVVERESLDEPSDDVVLRAPQAARSMIDKVPGTSEEAQAMMNGHDVEQQPAIPGAEVLSPQDVAKAIEVLSSPEASDQDKIASTLVIAKAAQQSGAPIGKPARIVRDRPTDEGLIDIGKGTEKKAYQIDHRKLGRGLSRTGAPKASEWQGTISTPYKVSNSTKGYSTERDGFMESFSVDLIDASSRAVSAHGEWVINDEASMHVVQRYDLDGNPQGEPSLTGVFTEGGNSYGWRNALGEPNGPQGWEPRHDEEVRMFYALMQKVGTSTAQHMLQSQQRAG